MSLISALAHFEHPLHRGCGRRRWYVRIHLALVKKIAVVRKNENPKSAASRDHLPISQTTSINSARIVVALLRLIVIVMWLSGILGGGPGLPHFWVYR